jgi:hypothetical protein
MPGEPYAGSGGSPKMHSAPPAGSGEIRTTDFQTLAGSGETQRTRGDTQEEHGVTRGVLAPRGRGDIKGSGERGVAR